MNPTDPILSADRKFWTDPLDGRTIPVVRGGSDPAGDPAQAPAADPASAPPPDAPAPDAPPADPGHSFETIDDAVAALRETRAEAAARRVEVKEAKAQAEVFLDSFAGYTEAERNTVLSIFKDLAIPEKQAKAAERLAEISARLLENEGDPKVKRPTGEEDPDERPLTKKELDRLWAERDEASATKEALKQIEAEATAAGFPPDSKDYTLLLSEMVDPEVAGDVSKAAERVKAYKQEIIDAYAKQVAAGAEKWPSGAPPAPPSAPGDPDAGPPKTFKQSRAAAEAWLTSRAGEA